MFRGAEFSAIATVELSRLAFVLVPTFALAGLLVCAYGASHMLGLAELLGLATAESGATGDPADLLQRYVAVLGFFVLGAVSLTLGVTGWWLLYIRGRSLTDQLKELD